MRGLDDLVGRGRGAGHSPAVQFAQSMGGIVALRAALAVPQFVRALFSPAPPVASTSAALGVVDWCAEFKKNSGVPHWFLGRS